MSDDRSSFGRRALRLLLAGAVGAASLLGGALDARAQQPPPPPPPPPAAPPTAPEPSYVVVTKDGSQYQGELVERVTGSHLTLKLATGEVRTIQLADVKAEWRGAQGQPNVAISVGGTPGVVINPLTGLGAITGVPLAYHGPDEVPIHLTNADTTSARGTLYHESASGWEIVCQMPCTTTIDPKGMYKLHNTDPFQFPAGAPLELVADIGGHRRYSGWGVLLLSLGIVGVTGGPFMLVNWDPTTAEGKSKPLDPTLKIAGWTTIGVSSAMLIAGIVLMAVNPSTTLTTTSGVRIAREPTIKLPGHLALTPSGLVF